MISNLAQFFSRSFTAFIRRVRRLNRAKIVFWFLRNYRVKYFTSISIAQYAGTGQGKWHKVYDKTVNSPPHPFKSLNSVTVDFAHELETDFGEMGVLELKNISFNRGRPVTEDGYKLSRGGGEGVLKKRRTVHITTRDKRFRGVTLVLPKLYLENYGHFLLDLVASLAVFKKAGFQFSDVKSIITPGIGVSTHFHKYFLDHFDFPFYKHHLARRHCNYQIETALIPTSLGGYKSFTHWLPEFFREEFLPSTSPVKRRRLFLSRAGYKRNIVNEALILDIVKSYDFEILHCAQIKQEDLIGIMAEASIVVAPHGSSLTNLVFCQPDTTILELLPTDHIKPYFFSLSHAAGLNYHCLVCRSQHERPKGTHGASEFDFYVDEVEFESALKSLLN